MRRKAIHAEEEERRLMALAKTRAEAAKSEAQKASEARAAADLRRRKLLFEEAAAVRARMSPPRLKLCAAVAELTVMKEGYSWNWCVDLRLAVSRAAVKLHTSVRADGSVQAALSALSQEVKVEPPAPRLAGGEGWKILRTWFWQRRKQAKAASVLSLFSKQAPPPSHASKPPAKSRAGEQPLKSPKAQRSPKASTRNKASKGGSNKPPSSSMSPDAPARAAATRQKGSPAAAARPGARPAIRAS